MSICPVCHRSGAGASLDCPTCHVALVPAGAPEHASAPAAPLASPYSTPPGGYPAGPPTGPLLAPPAVPPTAPPAGPPAGAPPGFAPLSYGPPPSAPLPTGAPGPVAPAWDRPRGSSNEPSASPVLVITAIVVGVLLVAAVGWFTLSGDDGGVDPAASGSQTTLTPAVISDQPRPGQSKATADGWFTNRSADGAWLYDTPVIPAAPSPLPSNPTVQVAYGITDTGRIGFGWGAGQLPEGTDEAAVLVEIMKGIALSRGAMNIEPTVLPAPTGPVVTAELQLSVGSALFVLRSVDRHPILAMVVVDLAAPDPAVATRMLDSFRPAS